MPAVNNADRFISDNEDDYNNNKTSSQIFNDSKICSHCQIKMKRCAIKGDTWLCVDCGEAIDELGIRTHITNITSLLRYPGDDGEIIGEEDSQQQHPFAFYAEQRQQRRKQLKDKNQKIISDYEGTAEGQNDDSSNGGGFTVSKGLRGSKYDKDEWQWLRDKDDKRLADKGHTLVSDEVSFQDNKTTKSAEELEKERQMRNKKKRR